MTTDTIKTNSSTEKRGVARWFFRETMGTVMAGVILFWCAGRWDWVWGWATVFTIAYYVFGTASVLLPKNPALLAERTGPKKGAKKWDTDFHRSRLISFYVFSIQQIRVHLCPNIRFLSASVLITISATC